jgi:hypothetical protein
MAFDHQQERMRARLHARAAAYRAAFMRGDAPLIDSAPWWQFWRKPKGGALSPSGETVLRDLAHYCYATKPTLKISHVTQQSDALAMAFAEGRRDVYNRIIGLCNLTPEQISSITQRNDHD